MSGFHEILVGVDLHQGDRLAAAELGPESRAAIDRACELASHSGGSITFCAVLDLSPQTKSLIDRDHANLLRTVEDVAVERLDQLVAEMTAKGISAKRLVRIGSPWEELSREATSGGYDVAVIGTRRRGGAARMLFGSTAQKLIRYAPCPVWVAKPEAGSNVRTIAVATDLSDVGLELLHQAVNLGKALDARVYVVHAIELNEIPLLMLGGVSEEEIFRAEARLKSEAEARLNSQLIQTDHRTLPHGLIIEMPTGSADRAIANFVAERNIDLLVIGTHGRRGIAGFVLGNTAERILPEIQSSLYAVKPRDFVSPYVG